MRDDDLITLTEADLLTLLGLQIEQLQASPQQELPPREPPVPGGPSPTFAGSRAHRQRYLQLGTDTAKRWLDDLHVGLQLALCDNGAPRQELQDLEGNAKDLHKLVAGAIVPLLSTNLPAAGMTAVTGIATTLGLILIKRRLVSFCTLPPPESDQSPDLPVITG